MSGAEFTATLTPGRSTLLEQMDPAKEYRGELQQSGDHVVEVINRGSRNTSCKVIIGME